MIDERKRWTPTPEAFVAYKARDFELARQNIEVARANGVSSTELLHSRSTAFVALQANLDGRPNRFARDPRQFSSSPRERKAAA